MLMLLLFFIKRGKKFSPLLFLIIIIQSCLEIKFVQIACGNYLESPVHGCVWDNVRKYKTVRVISLNHYQEDVISESLWNNYLKYPLILMNYVILLRLVEYHWQFCLH